MKVAVTFAAPEIVQVVLSGLVDLHPVQGATVNPGSGVAVRVTVGALVNCDWQVPVPKLEQLIPLGVLVTTPIPPPAVFTVTSSNPGTNPTQPPHVMTEMITTGIKHFPQLDMHFPSFASSTFDEHRAELVGFRSTGVN